MSADSPFPKGFFVINTLLLVVGVSLLLAYIGISVFITTPPYDYGILVSGADAFCFRPDVFEYNPLWLYPAPFYSAMCIPLALSPQITFILWMIVPFLMVVLLAGRRAAILIFPPFVLHMILGQSTWLIVPLFAYAYWMRNENVRWWHGVIAVLAVFKPHIAVLALVWLWYRFRHQRGFVLVSVVALGVFVLPSFVMQPDWFVEWLSNGRSFKLVSMANLGVIPVGLLDVGVGADNALDVAPVLSEQLLIYGFGAVVALVLLGGIYWRRGTLTFYDWVLVFCLTNPLIHDYDLVLLIPFIGRYPRRLLLVLVVSVIVWVYAMITMMYHASILIPLALYLSRWMIQDERFNRIGAVVKW